MKYGANNANKGAASKQALGRDWGRRHLPAACPIGVDPSVQSLLHLVVVKVRLDVVDAARVVAGKRLTHQKLQSSLHQHV